MSASAASGEVPREARRGWEWWPFAFIVLVWLPSLMRCSIEWSLNAQYYYGWAVPLLAGYLAYERLTPVPVLQRGRHWILALCILLLFALPHPVLRVVGEANTDWRLVSWAMAFSALGISLATLYLAGGWLAVRRFVFPLCFLFTAIPWPSQQETLLVQGMMQINAVISAEFVSLCGVPAIATGNVIELPTGVLGVNEACSGIRSLQSTFMASLFLGGLYRLRWFPRFSLVVLGVGIAFLLNVVRTVFLSWQGAFHGIEATEKWHDSAGFAILAAVLVCLWLISRAFEKHSARSSVAGASD